MKNRVFGYIACIVLVACSFAFAKVDEACVDDCYEAYNEEVNACSIEYLDKLLKCHPSLRLAEKCFDIATDEYNECIEEAGENYIGCLNTCGDDEEEPDPVTPEEQKCIDACDDEHHEREDACFSQWFGDAMMCSEIIDTNIEAKCMRWALQDYNECKAKSKDEQEDCLSGC